MKYFVVEQDLLLGKENKFNRAYNDIDSANTFIQYCEECNEECGEVNRFIYYIQEETK